MLHSVWPFDCCLCKVEAERDEARHQLAEAAEAVRLLLAWARRIHADNLFGWGYYMPGLVEWRALPVWMREEIER